MTNNSLIAFALVTLFSIQLFVALKFGIVGIHGMGTRRDESPAVFWLGVVLIIVCLGAALAVALNVL